MDKDEVRAIGNGLFLEFTGVDFRLFTEDDENEIFMDETTAADLVAVLEESLGE
jgi:hypothetical protein